MTLHWRVRDELLVVSCADGTAYVWQMLTGHLDRRAAGRVAADIVAGCDGSLTYAHTHTRIHSH
jgi:hypothetical protein